ncbi:unnamed protein product [Urochloa humidicola]
MTPRTRAAATHPPPAADPAPPPHPRPPAARRRRQGLPVPPGRAASGRPQEELQEGPTHRLLHPCALPLPSALRRRGLILSPFFPFHFDAELQ